MARPTDEPLLQKLIRLACEELVAEVVPVIFTPWQSDAQFTPKPEHILAPPSDSDVLNEADIQHFTQHRNVILGGCMFTDSTEVAAVVKVTQQLLKHKNLCVLVAHIIPPGVPVNSGNMDMLLEYYDQFTSAGVADIIVAPDLNDAIEFASLITVAIKKWETNVYRQQLVLEVASTQVSDEDIEALQNQHQQLLWNSIPCALMPQLPKCSFKEQETATSISTYEFFGKFATVRGGNVLEAFDTSQNQKMVVLKIVDKTEIFMPGEVEGIYREMRFTGELLRHPNLPRCINALHTKQYIYLVFEHAGSQNLENLLLAFPDHRFKADVALDCFKQIAAAISYCHSKKVSHRSLTLHHVAVKQQEDVKYHCTVVDFRTAMVAKQGATSTTQCGTPPFIAPEVMKGLHTPKIADCWSAGIILLEIAGGCGSTHKILNFATGMQEMQDAMQIFFTAPDCYQKALTIRGATPNSTVEKLLEVLLRLEEAKRATMEETLVVLAHQ